MTDQRDKELSTPADAIAVGEYTILDEPAELPPAATEDPSGGPVAAAAVERDATQETVSPFLKSPARNGCSPAPTRH